MEMEHCQFSIPVPGRSADMYSNADAATCKLLLILLWLACFVWVGTKSRAVSASCYLQKVLVLPSRPLTFVAESRCSYAVNRTAQRINGPWKAENNNISFHDIWWQCQYVQCMSAYLCQPWSCTCYHMQRNLSSNHYCIKSIPTSISSTASKEK